MLGPSGRQADSDGRHPEPKPTRGARSGCLFLCTNPAAKPAAGTEPRQMYVGNASSGFWRLVNERLGRVGVINGYQFPLHLRELAFRYNNRDSDLFDKITEHMCTYVPGKTLH